MLGGACAVMRELLFLGWLVGTPTLITAQNLLGFTGGGRSALYWGRSLCSLTGVREKVILHFEF